MNSATADTRVGATETPRGAQPDEAPYLLDRRPRLALWLFVAVEVAALAFYVWAGRQRWFFHDEWNYLVGIDGGDLDSLLAPHNGHWTTLPKIFYRVWFNVFGLRFYLPYQIVTIVLHLVAAALLRLVMRRSGVSAWMATTAAVAFVLFGAGDHNILRAFQVTFTGALVLGLVHMLLADHDGPVDRRDWIGLVAGTAALMCSGVGIAMLAATALAVLIGRGWRRALFHLVPPLAVYGIWYVLYSDGTSPTSSAGFVRKVEVALGSLFDMVEALGHFRVVGFVLLAVLSVGMPLACWHLHGAQLRRRIALPVGLLFGALVFVSLTAWSRATPTASITQSRYLHIIAALGISALALSADAISRRWIVMTPVVLLVFIVGIPGNVSISWNQEGEGRGRRFEELLFPAFPRVSAAEDAPEWVRPDPQSAPTVTLGWLRDVMDAGRLPEPRQLTPAEEDAVRLRMSVQLVNDARVPVDCPALSEKLPVHLEEGEVLPFTGSIRVLRAGTRPTPLSQPEFKGGARAAVQAVDGPVDLIVSPDVPGLRTVVCPVRPGR